MEKSSMLGLSTACISSKTADIINEIAFGHESSYEGLIAYPKHVYGWFVHVSEEIELENLPEDLKNCLNYAKLKGCEWIMFDRDIEYNEKDGLPYFNWRD